MDSLFIFLKSTNLNKKAQIWLKIQNSKIAYMA